LLLLRAKPGTERPLAGADKPDEGGGKWRAEPHRAAIIRLSVSVFCCFVFGANPMAAAALKEGKRKKRVRDVLPVTAHAQGRDGPRTVQGHRNPRWEPFVLRSHDPGLPPLIQCR
jgi:hypothetical protein